MCLLKTNTVPVVVGALGLIKKGTQEQSNNIPDALSLQGIKSNNSKMNNPYAKSFVHLRFFSVFCLSGHDKKSYPTLAQGRWLCPVM